MGGRWEMKTTPLINNFNGGELSPKLDARSDINKYYSGCKTLQNMVPLVEGGAQKMPGTYYVAISRYADVDPVTTRLVPFHFSTTQGYILEFSPTLIRFYKDDGLIVYAATDASDFDPTASYGFHDHAKVGDTLNVTVSGTKMLFFAPPYGQTTTSIVGVRVLSALDDNLSVSWNSGTSRIWISLANTTGAKNAANLIQAALRALGTAGTVDVSAWTVTENAAYAAARPATITAVIQDSRTGGGIYCCDVAVTGNATNTSRFPNDETTYWTEFIVGTSVYISTTYADSEIFDLKFCQSADVLYIFHPSHAPAKLQRYSHVKWILSDLLATNGETKTIAAITKATQGKVTTDTNHGFKVGDMVYFANVAGMTELNTNTYKVSRRISKTVFKIDCDTSGFTTFTDDNNGTVIRRIFYAADKYPSCGTFFEQRLCVAGSNDEPSAIDASVVSDYENFDKDPDEDDYGWKFTLVSSKVDRIRWLLGQDYLMAGTAGGVWKIGGSASGEPATQANISPKKHVYIGVANLDPQEVSDGILWVPRSNLGLRKLIYSWESDRWVAVDMTRLAEHITKGSTLALSGIKQTAFMQEPSPIFWAIRNDGVLLGMTYETQEEVYAWFRIVGSDCKFKSVAVLSQDNEEDQIWVVIDRTVGSATWRSIEYFKPFEFYATIANAFFVHSGLTYAAGNTAKVISGITKANPAVVTTTTAHGLHATDKVRITGVVGMTEVNQATPPSAAYTVGAVTTYTFALQGVNSTAYTAYASGGSAIGVTNLITGLAHLEGKVVDILVDGYVNSGYTVTSGNVQAGLYGNTFQIGMPYDAIVEPMKLHAGSQSGTARGKSQKVNRLTCCFYNTGKGVYAGRDSSNLLEVTGLTDGALTTVDKNFEFPGNWGSEATLYMKHSKPLPWSLLALIPRVSLNED